MKLNGSRVYLATRLTILAALLGVLGLLVADRAQASEHPVWPETLEAVCPDGSLPAIDPQGEYADLVEEIRRATLDARERCEAHYELGFEAAEELLAALEVIDARIQLGNAKLDDLDAQLVAGVLVEADAAGLDVREVEPQAASEASTEAIEAAAQVNKEALWAIAGLMAGFFCAYCFYRQMMPRG